VITGSPGSSEAAPPVARAATAGAAKADAEPERERKTAEGGVGGAGAVDQLMNLKFL